MPKKKTVRSLERLCLEYVANNIEDFWAREYTSGGHQSHDPLGPFNMLASFLVQDLYRLVKKNHRLTLAVLRLFLVPQLMELDFRFCVHKLSNSVAQITAMHCKKLSTLDLFWCRELTPRTLIDLVKGLPSLVKLGLSGTQCNTHVLIAVRSCCPRLRDLEILSCHNLSSESLLHLVYDPVGATFCCQALGRLATNPSFRDIHKDNYIPVLAFVLLALPNLKRLCHVFMAEAVALIHSQQFGSAQVPPGFPSLDKVARRHRTFGLPGQESTWPMLGLREAQDVDDLFLSLVTTTCPHLEGLSVILSGRPGWSTSFSSFRSISKLSLCAKSYMDLRAILPVLATLGAQLQALSLSNFCFIQHLSFHALLRLCANLQKLSIYFFSPTAYERRVEEQPAFEALEWDFSLPPCQFPRLCDFSLTYADMENSLAFPHTWFLSHCLQELLTHAPRLETLKLARLPFDMDQLFLKVLVPTRMALLHLKKMTLVEICVSLTSMHSLIFAENELRSLRLLLCSKISLIDYKRIQERIRLEGLDLEVEWG